MANHQPLILTDPSIKISKTALETGLTELACDASHVELTPDTQITTVDTFCGSTDYPGITKWSLVATLVQSFDAEATEEVLSAALAVGDEVPFELIGYKSQPVSATNPRWYGKVRPAPYSPINGDAGDASTVELEWAVTEGPIKATTEGAGLLIAGGAMMTGESLDDKTVEDLKEMASERGVATSGTKAELIERLSAE